MASKSQTDLARANIKALLALREKSSFEVSTALGRDRTYLDDYIKGRKKSVSLLFATDLSKLLDASFLYIAGDEPIPEEKNKIIGAKEDKAYDLMLERNIKVANRNIEILKKDAKIALFGKERILDDIRDEELKIQRYEDQRAKRSSAISQHESVQYQIEKKYGEQGWYFPENYIANHLHASVENLIVLYISDNAMSKQSFGGFLQGDRAIIDQSRHDYRAGGVFAITENDLIMIRQIEMISASSPQKFNARPFNPDYPGFNFEVSGSFQVIGRVIARIGGF